MLSKGKHWKLSLKTRKKMSEHIKTEEHKRNAGRASGLARKGKPASPLALKHLLQLADIARGKKRSHLVCKKIAIGKMGNKNPNWRGGTRAVICKECNKFFFVTHKRIERGVHFCSRNCMGKFRNINNKTPINALIRGSTKYRLWREAVFKRDNWTCVWCGARSGSGVAVVLNADHVKSFAYYPELRFDINNGRTLCISCHRKTDTYANNLSKRTVVAEEEP